MATRAFCVADAFFWGGGGYCCVPQLPWLFRKTTGAYLDPAAYSAHFGDGTPEGCSRSTSKKGSSVEQTALDTVSLDHRGGVAVA